ncbi:hypothetical protein BKA61DRAFT_609657 [Leptodontidium sp. MPI-SDFR-AT-0119]|nr:hypothetical protein BKA61DRAFT_609657 [Leptodontidium sp. MPI-SDFR-AT-0119]
MGFYYLCLDMSLYPRSRISFTLLNRASINYRFLLLASRDNGLPVINPRDSDYSLGNVSLSSNHDLDEILKPSLYLTGSDSYGSSPPLDNQGSYSKAEPDLPMCKTAFIKTVTSLFPRPDLINILNKYWEVLRVHGLFADQSREPFQRRNAINGPVHFYCEVTRQRINGTQARGSSKNNNNKAYKEYVKHMFLDGDPETLLGVGVSLIVGPEIKKRMCG